MVLITLMNIFYLFWHLPYYLKQFEKIYDFLLLFTLLNTELDEKNNIA